MVAMRGRSGDRVLRAARQLKDAGELTLSDAARICGFLLEVGDARGSRAATRLVGQITLACELQLEEIDVVLELARGLPDPQARDALLRFCERADMRLAAQRPTAAGSWARR
jgi:hypothetical protein